MDPLITKGEEWEYKKAGEMGRGRLRREQKRQRQGRDVRFNDPPHTL